jgi:hypothetical protein
VSFAEWVKNGWLVAHKSSKQEIANPLGIVARDLKAAKPRMCRTIGGSQSPTTRHCKRRPQRCTCYLQLRHRYP